MDTEQLGRLRDILEAARLIGSYVKDTTETDFRADTQKQDAVIRRIEIIGEAAAHLNEETRQAIPELPFRKAHSNKNRSNCPPLPLPRQPCHGQPHAREHESRATHTSKEEFPRPGGYSTVDRGSGIELSGSDCGSDFWNEKVI